MAVTIENITFNINAIDWSTRDTGFIPEDGDIWYYKNHPSFPNTLVYLIGNGASTIETLNIYSVMNNDTQAFFGVKTFGNIVSFSNDVNIGSGFGTTSLALKSALGSTFNVTFADGAISRWIQAKTAAADLTFNNLDAAGTFLGTPLTMWNATGNMTTGANLHVSGTLSKAAGTFDIPHVLPKLNNATGLRHSFVESPRLENRYTGSIKLIKGKAIIDIDKEFKMSNGTFEALNIDSYTHSSNESGYTNVKSKLVGSILTIEAQESTCTDIVFWEVVSRRHDQYIMDCDITDDDGNLIVEYKMGKTLEEKGAEKVAVMKEYEAHRSAKSQ